MKELTPLFKMLRAQGFDARQGFKCCSGCAGAAIAHEYKEKAEKDRSFGPKGFVFFHKQDRITDEKTRRAHYDKRDPSMMLRYGSVEYTAKTFNGEPIPGKTDQTWGLPGKEIGDAVVAALKACNIPYEWDGNPDKCIEIFPLGRTQKTRRAS